MHTQVMKACYTCLKTGEVGKDLSYCMRCRTSLYCSKECQKKDWWVQ